jgi:hypothetical protein
LINDSKVQIKIQKIKQDLLVFRDGKTRSGRRIPDSIRNEIIELNKTGWSVYQVEKEFQLASSAIYRWLKGSKNAEAKDNLKSNTEDQGKSSVSKIKRPKQLKLVEDVTASKIASLISEELIQIELRSGIKLNIPQKQLSLELIKSLNSL